MTDYLGISVDYSRDKLFDEFGLKRLRQSYMRDDEKSPQERFAFVSKKFGSNPEHAQRLYDYASQHWLSYSTPILSFGRSKNSLSISCFLSNLTDSRESLVNTLSEVNWLSMLGGGIGIGVNIRSADDKSVGVIPHLKTYDACSLAYRQSMTRRGSYAAYLDVNHPDLIKFIELRKPTGDLNARCQNLHHGINITNDFMEIIEKCTKDPKADDTWNLIDPHTKEIKQKVSAKHIWELILTSRMTTGEPYLHFIDTSNKYLPEWQKNLGLRINQSNLCVKGDTKLLTKTGYVEIQKLVGTKIEIWNGLEWSEVVPFKTGENQKLLKIQFSKGQEICCTEYHKFYIPQDGYFHSDDAIEVPANELQVGTILNSWKMPESWKFKGIDNAKVSSIENLEGLHDTYCVNEPKRHRVIFNGVETGNCSEIFLATDDERTAVCCLSSLNLEYYDDWKDNSIFLEDVAEMLDNVLSYFIESAPDEVSRASFSAMRERSIGIGTLGFHSYLQKKGIAFESVTAKSVNKKIYKNIKEVLWDFNKKLAAERGECPDAEGYGYRFSHMTAIAPNASTSILLGNTSPSIEPYSANIFRQETLGGLNVHKNKYLDKKIDVLCKERSMDKAAIWSEILSNEGSIQNLEYFDENTKYIFKTAKEIDQRWIVDLASDRQDFIDQGQSVNLFFPANVDVKYLHDVHFAAWKKGLKSLYYCRTEKITKIDKVGKAVKRKEIKNNDECLACEG